MLQHDAGVLCAPTAFGKTVTAAAIIARRGVNTLVLVHRTELMKQWQERLQAFLGVGKGMIGTIGAGKSKPTGQIDIAVMQALSRQGEVNALVENYGQVVVDECHHVGALVRRHPQTLQSQVRLGPDRHADPPRWPAAHHLHAMRPDPAQGGKACQRAT
jgi:superfamily II DNA or RNA helicase